MLDFRGGAISAVHGAFFLNLGNSLPEADFNTRMDKVREKIRKWKLDGDFGDEQADVLAELKVLKRLFKDKEESVDALSTEVVKHRRQIRKEKKERESDNKNLSDMIADLEKDKLDLRRVMLVRALATATQFAVAEKFNGLFSGRYAYSTTIDDIRKKVYSKSNTDAKSTATYRAMIALFAAEGVNEADVPQLIKNIRKIGTNNIHPMTMIDSQGLEHQPDVVEMSQIIAASPVEVVLKDDAVILLRVLAKIQDKNLPLLATTTTAVKK